MKRRLDLVADGRAGAAGPDSGAAGQGLFFEIEPLVRAGRLKEAAAALKRLARAGAEPWETLLWAGRIAEKKGRRAEAEKAFRKALAADPASPSLELEFARFLEDNGRLAEAEARLLRALKLGAPAGEGHLALGRLRERLGRLPAAEADFRAAAAAAPSSPLPQYALARICERSGRAAEAQAALREAAAKAAGELAALSRGLLRQGLGEGSGPAADRGRLFTLLDIELYRQPFLAAARAAPAASARWEAALRAALAAEPRAAGARTLLAEVLLERGRLAQAEGEFVGALAAGVQGAQDSRLAVLLKLIENGRYGRRLERALLGWLRRAEGEDKIVEQWPQVFSALMCARRYAAAFRLGEARLDRGALPAAPQALMWPWWRKLGRAVAEEGFCAAELVRMRRAARAGGFARWFAFYRAILLSYGGRFEEAMAGIGLGQAPPRYAWMRQSFVLVKLDLLDYEGAIAMCRDILKHAPGHWWVRCRMGEAYLAKGSQDRGLREFARAARVADPAARREALTWHGEVLLWLGDYRGALALFDEAVALGARTFVFGWRGAARLKLGDLPKALEDLDRAIALDPKDLEAYLWRGEARRLLGRHAESLRDLESFMRSGPDCPWAHLNRGLARLALGDEAGLAADFAAVDPETIAFIRGRLGIPGQGALSAARMREVMTAGLELAKGVRRWEYYLRPIWMGKT